MVTITKQCKTSQVLQHLQLIRQRNQSSPRCQKQIRQYRILVSFVIKRKNDSHVFHVGILPRAFLVAMLSERVQFVVEKSKHLFASIFKTILYTKVMMISIFSLNYCYLEGEG